MDKKIKIYLQMSQEQNTFEDMTICFCDLFDVEWVNGEQKVSLDGAEPISVFGCYCCLMNRDEFKMRNIVVPKEK